MRIGEISIGNLEPICNTSDSAEIRSSAGPTPVTKCIVFVHEKGKNPYAKRDSVLVIVLKGSTATLSNNHRLGKLR